jgi:hypothetical protein
MARRKAFVHVGLPHSGGTILEAALDHHEATLARLGIQRPAKSADEMFRAAVELLRDHRAWGYRRRDVEGSWSSVCRRARKGKGTVVVGQHLLAAAAPVEIELLLDGLAGFEVHAVLVAPAPGTGSTDGGDDRGLDEVRARWSAALGHPDRVHVIVAPETTAETTAETSAADRSLVIWEAYGRAVGFDASQLRLPEVPAHQPVRQLAVRHSPLWELEPSGDLTEHRLRATEAALADTLVEAARLRARNEALELRNGKLERTRKKLKRRLADAVVG